MRVGEQSKAEKAGLYEVAGQGCRDDPNVLGELYDLYYPRVLGLCRRLLDRQEDAEDAAADVFLKVQRAIASYDPSLPFLSWLLSVARHHCVDRLRRRRLESRLFAAEDITATVSTGRQPCPLSEILNHEQRQRVRELIDRLPERYRFSLILRYYNEMSYSEIAKTLGMGRNSVATAIFRAKKELRRKMEASVLSRHKVAREADTARPDPSGRSVSKALTVNRLSRGPAVTTKLPILLRGRVDFCGAS